MHGAGRGKDHSSDRTGGDKEVGQEDVKINAGNAGERHEISQGKIA